MQATFIPKDIDRLLAEADELIKQIDSNAIKDLERSIASSLKPRSKFEKNSDLRFRKR